MEGTRAFEQLQVTPYVGVWIETVLVSVTGRSLSVTPYVGVWIETNAKYTAILASAGSLLMWECGLKHHIVTKGTVDEKSLLMWECGLKPPPFCASPRLPEVTPYVGVWIETCHILIVY